MKPEADSALKLQNSSAKIILNEDGAIAQLDFLEGGGWNEIRFRSDEFRGPAWFVEQDGAERPVALVADPERRGAFSGALEQVHFSLEYRLGEGALVLRAGLRNAGRAAFSPARCGIKLGLDTYMVSAPEWDELYFPTLLRCEKTHFWGYCMSPLGRILGIASPDPVASWSMDYNSAVYGEHRHGGHRIYTFNLDLLNRLPLPARHPQNLAQLLPGESKSWTITLLPVAALEQVKPVLAELCAAPMLACERHSLAAGESARVRMFSSPGSTLTLTHPDGSAHSLQSEAGGEGEYSVSLGSEPGVYTLTGVNSSGKQSEARLYLRQPWSWYLRQARREALDKPQKASTHMETWLGFYSAFLARKHFPDASLDGQAEAQFRAVLVLMYDLERAEPILDPGRIQNSAAMIGLLTDLYEVGGNLQDLELAARLADWIIPNQDKDGAYRASASYSQGVHYTSVAYMAKYMLELAQAEQGLGGASPLWQERSQRHYRSAQAAVDDLERLRDRIGTEGEHTFEDGMISCTAAQLGLFALLQSDPAQREKYTAAARQVLHKHRCLEQNLIPDCRMHGATLRFWEAQYDVLIKHNMFSSPHGWTSWKTYATWYLYQLTGEEDYLRQTMDTLGACMQVVDLERGELRWGFICDPYISTRIFQPDPARAGQGLLRDAVLGEQYIEMLSGWWRAAPGRATGGYWEQGGCCDNDVHEHFKCLEEVALTSAYVLERADGQLVSWNCRVEAQEDGLHVFPAEAVVSAVHFNLKNPGGVTVHFTAERLVRAAAVPSLSWVRLPEE